MTDRVVIIVQARMSSSRLPGKVLMPLAGRPSIVRLMERLESVTGATEALVATSNSTTDDDLARLCSQHGIRCERGALEDVLDRYHAAARAADAGTVVRITGDCPLHEAAIIDRCIRLYLSEAKCVDYVSNADERTYPDGLDVEVFSMESLEAARREASSRFEREHVTPYICRHRRKLSMVQNVDLSDLRWTLDFPVDYKAISTIYDALQSPDQPSNFRVRQVYEFLLAQPHQILTSTRESLSDADVENVTSRIVQLLTIEG